MSSERRALNPEILKDRLPDNYLNILNQAERNVNVAVGQIIDDYKKHLDSLATQLEEGRFTEELQTKISEIHKTLKAELGDLEKSAKTIKENADKLKDSDTESSSLKKQAESLASDVEKLQDRLTKVREKVNEVGDLSGKVLAKALRSFIA